VRKAFNTISVLILLTGAAVAILPTLVMPDLIYPQRIDSAYVAFQQRHTDHKEIYYNPSDLNLTYENLNVRTEDSITLNGWYISVPDSEAATLIVIHDINESKLKYLNLAKQMHDRGLKVYLFDLRAHGSSEGEQFSPGLLSANDVKSIMDSLEQKDETAHIVLMGIGIGAGIALQAAALDYRCEALIAQCPYDDFSEYVQRYAQEEWKGLKKIYAPILKRKLYLVLHHRDKDLVLSDISKVVTTPSLFISASEDSVTPPREARALFDSSWAEQKDLILVRKANHDNVEMVGGDAYYNVITEFINSSIPKKVKKVRFKKLT
jgi:uncharacterized protein